MSDDLRGMLRAILVLLDEIRGEIQLLHQIVRTTDLNTMRRLYHPSESNADEETD
jgi:hypothetical protein